MIDQPHLKGLFKRKIVVAMEPYLIQSRLWKWAVAEAERQHEYFERLISKFYLPRLGLEYYLPGIHLFDGNLN